MSKLRTLVLSAMMAVLLTGLVATAGFDVASAAHHAKTHPTAAHVSRRANHHGSGVKSHQHHARHARHARSHGQHKHSK